MNNNDFYASFYERDERRPVAKAFGVAAMFLSAFGMLFFLTAVVAVKASDLAHWYWSL